MSMFSSIRTFLGFVFTRSRAEREMEEELRSHLQIRADDLERRGLSRAEAERQARVEFGGYQRYKEECREALGTRLLSELVADLRYGLRQLRRSPGFTAVAVITLALGIGASTAIFSVVYPVLVNPYPYKGAARMVGFTIMGRTKGDERDWYSLDEFRAIRDQNRVFDGVVGYSAVNWVLSGDGLPEIVSVTAMTADAFRYFGVPPLLGRVFTRADAPPGKTAVPVAVLSFRFWKRHYGNARNILGKTIRLEGKPYTIIGVLPARFAWHGAEIYVPTDSSWEYVWVGARRRPGVPLRQATADVGVIFHRLAKLHPRDYPTNGFTIKMEGLEDWSLGSFQERLLLLITAVGLLLLIACCNIANLQFAKGSAREAEIAVRASVGANRGRIIRQLLTESVTLSLLGGALGILLAFAGVRLIVLIMPPGAIPHEVVLGVNGLALAFTVALSVVVGSVAGLPPALRLSDFNLAESLCHGESRGAGSIGRNRTRKILIVSEYAIALVLLASAGLTLSSFLALRAVRLGFDPSHILTMNIPVNWGSTRWEKRVSVLTAILNRIESLPGVKAAALSIDTDAPPWGGFHTANVEGGPSQGIHLVHMNLVSPGFFQTFHIPLIRGQLFTDNQVQQGEQVVVVSRSAARLLWSPGENPIGREIHLPLRHWEIPGIGSPPDLTGWCRVIGIVGDVLNNGLQRPSQPAVYIPYTLMLPSQAALSLSSSSNPMFLVHSVRSAIASEANGQPVTDIWRYSDALEEFSLAHDRFSAVLFLLFGVLGLVLCASGAYSVVSYAVSRRTHEIGIRMALGAQRQHVLWLVVEETMSLALIGIGIGLAGAATVTRLFANQVFQLHPLDPISLLIVSVILGLVALFACYLPARRAMKVDPMVALRYE
ncbi:MAG TPA: ABC transporter permease [Terriglobia bacterium]|nr:ABC transporter permease [Terriglobia bacterium]